jgi:endonuclease YncB( thermonuclease family)
MKKLLTLLLLVPLLAFAQGKQKPGVTYDAVITRVIDGDTVAFQAPFLPASAQARTVNPSVWR